MQKWEYLSAEFRTNSYSLNGGEPVNYERSTAGQPSITPQAVDTLNKLGREGWELVQTSSAFYVKRAISN